MNLETIIAEMCASLDGIAGTLKASAEMTRETASHARAAADRLAAQQQPQGGDNE